MNGRRGPPAPIETVTFGCRLNIVESEAMRSAARAAGHDNLVIVNTCAVTAEASRQSRQAVRRANRDHPGAALIVTGCAAQIEPGVFAAMTGVDRVLGNTGKTAPEAWARGPGEVGPAMPSGRQAALGPNPPGGHTRGFVEIQNGCDHRCTFCIIPFGRGHSRSVPPAEVVTAVRRAVEAGTREVVLTGVDVTSYAAEGAATFGVLLKRILRQVPDLPRLRLSSIDCIEADRDLFDVLAAEPRFMPHLHLSLQSGSDLILKRMKRRHSRSEALAFCRQARRLRPEIAFGADVIAGFPTETEAQAAETEDLVSECGIAYLHVFPFSARPGTPATRMPAVSPAVVKARAARLRSLGETATRRHLETHVGGTRRVLTERGNRARTEDFAAVRVPFAEPGRLIAATIIGQNGRELIASTIAETGGDR